MFIKVLLALSFLFPLHVLPLEVIGSASSSTKDEGEQPSNTSLSPLDKKCISTAKDLWVNPNFKDEKIDDLLKCMFLDPHIEVAGKCGKVFYDIVGNNGRVLPKTGYNIRYDYAVEATYLKVKEYFTKASSKDFKIGDLGCGFGLTTFPLAFIMNDRVLGQIILVDAVEKNIKQAQKVLKNFKEKIRIPNNVTFNYMIRFLQDLDSTNTFGSQADGTFDILICLNVMHLMSIGEKQKLIQTCWRVLKPGGILIASHLMLNKTNIPPTYPVPKSPGGYLSRYVVHNASELLYKQKNTLEGDFEKMWKIDEKLAQHLTPQFTYDTNQNPFPAGRLPSSNKDGKVVYHQFAELLTEASWKEKFTKEGFSPVEVIPGTFDDRLVTQLFKKAIEPRAGSVPESLAKKIADSTFDSFLAIAEKPKEEPK